MNLNNRAAKPSLVSAPALSKYSPKIPYMFFNGYFSSIHLRNIQQLNVAGFPVIKVAKQNLAKFNGTSPQKKMFYF